MEQIFPFFLGRLLGGLKKEKNETFIFNLGYILASLRCPFLIEKFKNKEIPVEDLEKKLSIASYDILRGQSLSSKDKDEIEHLIDLISSIFYQD